MYCQHIRQHGCIIVNTVCYQADFAVVKAFYHYPTTEPPALSFLSPGDPLKTISEMKQGHTDGVDERQGYQLYAAGDGGIEVAGNGVSDFIGGQAAQAMAFGADVFPAGVAGEFAVAERPAILIG